MQAPKNGFFYVLDAATGQFISADNYVPQNWALGIDPVTGRADVDPKAHYDTTGEAVIITPGPGGGHTWHPWAFNPDTGLVYLPAHYTSGAFMSAPETRIGIYNVGVDWMRSAYLYDEPGNAHFPHPAKPTSQLIAWDPVARKAVWKAQMKADNGAGVLATASGLVFQGSSATEELIAYRAGDGERLWSQPIGAGAGAAPVSYEVDGEQYIALVVGAGARGGYYAPNHSRVLAFRLGGSAELPPAAPVDMPVLDPPPATAPADLVAKGQDIYTLNCAICHGDGAVARASSRGTLFPDLRYSGALHEAEDFNAIVLMGERQKNGMRSFASVLGPQDTDAIRAYIIAQANSAK
jgi:mono/diheme cytochrome c family protein